MRNGIQRKNNDFFGDRVGHILKHELERSGVNLGEFKIELFFIVAIRNGNKRKILKTRSKNIREEFQKFR